MTDVLLLTENLARNYDALQNFLMGIPGPRRPRRSSYGKNAKARERKKRMIEAQGCKCMDCQKPFTFEVDRYVDATADHVIPFRFGSTLEMNCEFVCHDCNMKREGYRMSVILRYFGNVDCT